MIPDTDGPDKGGGPKSDRAQLCVTLGIDLDGDEPELAVTYFYGESRSPSVWDDDYWDHVVDLRD